MYILYEDTVILQSLLCTLLHMARTRYVHSVLIKWRGRLFQESIVAQFHCVPSSPCMNCSCLYSFFCVNIIIKHLQNKIHHSSYHMQLQLPTKERVRIWGSTLGCSLCWRIPLSSWQQLLLAMWLHSRTTFLSTLVMYVRCTLQHLCMYTSTYSLEPVEHFHIFLACGVRSD